jgi:hypothetical protein
MAYCISGRKVGADSKFEAERLAFILSSCRRDVEETALRSLRVTENENHLYVFSYSLHTAQSFLRS